MSASTASKTPSIKTPKAAPKKVTPKVTKPKAAGKVSAKKNEEVLAKAKLPTLESAPADIDPAQREAEQIADQESQNAMAFAIQQLSASKTPVATPPSAEQLKRQEYEAAVAALAKQYDMPIPNTRLSSSATKDTQNGVTRPAPETKCGKIWAAADSLSSDTAPASIAALKLHSSCMGVNEHTIKTQYARWRAYNGVKGRIVPSGTIVPEVSE